MKQMEDWLYSLADVEGFAASDDDLSRLIHDILGMETSDELDEDELQSVVAARMIPPLRCKPEAP